MYICNSIGEMAEWSNAAVLKTVEGHTSGGSNPSLSATFISSMLISSVLEAQLHTWCTIWGLSMPDEDLLRNCVPLR